MNYTKKKLSLPLSCLQVKSTPSLWFLEDGGSGNEICMEGVDWCIRLMKKAVWRNLFELFSLFFFFFFFWIVQPLIPYNIFKIFLKWILNPPGYLQSTVFFFFINNSEVGTYIYFLLFESENRIKKPKLAGLRRSKGDPCNRK